MNPEIGTLSAIMSAAAGACVLSALYHVFIAVTCRGDRVHLSFAAMSAAASLWMWFGITKFATTDPDVFVRAVEARVFWGHLLAIAAIWFWVYHAEFEGRVLPWCLTGLVAAFIGYNAWSPYGAYFSGPPNISPVSTPWGEQMSRAMGPFEAGYVAEFVLVIALAAFGTAMIVRSRRRAGTSAVPLVLTSVAILAGFAASVSYLRVSIPSAELAYVGVIVVMGLALAKEISGATEAQGALMRTRERLEAVVQSAPEAMCLLDARSGVVTFANQEALGLFGVADGGVVDFTALDFAPDAQPDGSPSVSVWDRRWVSALAGNRVAFPWLVEGAEGRLVSCQAVLVRLPGEDPPLIRFSLVDMSTLEEERDRGARLEEQLHQSLKLEAVGRLTGGVAHDFNNLLTVMRGSLELLLEDGASVEESEALVREALEAVDRSAALTQRLLAFSRKQPLAPRRLDMHDLISNTGALLRRTLGDHIEVDYDLPADIWPISVDPAQLENALVNLSINAADAMEQGGRLRIGARNVLVEPDDFELMDALSPGPYVRIHVEDTGHGMDEATVGRVIEPFFTTKEVGKGTGLGLSMVYGFATQSGGTLRILSASGEGTTVYLYFPRHEDVGARPVPV